MLVVSDSSDVFDEFAGHMISALKPPAPDGDIVTTPQSFSSTFGIVATMKIAILHSHTHTYSRNCVRQGKRSLSQNRDTLVVGKSGA